MPLTLPANGGQSAVQAVAVVPEESVAALVDLAGPLLGVDHEQPAWADDEVDALMVVKAPVAHGLGGLGSWS
jgi:hypothetical protein